MISTAISSVVHHVPASLDIDIRIHVTRGVNGSDSKGSISEEEVSSSSHDPEKSPVADEQSRPTSIILEHPDINVSYGRPDIPAILKAESDATRGGKISISSKLSSNNFKSFVADSVSLEVCGSESMVRSARSSLGLEASNPARILRGGADISLFIEGFGYA